MKEFAMTRQPSSSIRLLAAAVTMVVAIPGVFAQAPPAHTHYAKPPGYDQARLRVNRSRRAFRISGSTCFR